MEERLNKKYMDNLEVENKLDKIREGKKFYFRLI